jgi:uncharacterized membrane protein
MSAIATFMPAAEKLRAMARPIPLAPPVMNATLPVTSNIDIPSIKSLEVDSIPDQNGADSEHPEQSIVVNWANLEELILAAVLFVITHLGISSTPLRGVLVRSIGERGYLGLYSILAVITLVYLIISYNHASHVEFLWQPSAALRGIAFAVMPIAFIFALGGFLTKNPTAVGQEKQVKNVGQGAGLLRITRHPFQWSVVLWASVHIVANADAASLIFFGSLGLLSLTGSFLIDMKKARTVGADWAAFAGATSNVPFLAILASRNQLVMRELYAPIGVGLAAYVLVVWGHRYISGVALF